MLTHTTHGPGGSGGEAEAQRQSRSRLLALKISLVVCFVAVGLRLVQIQVIDAPMYQEKARKQYQDKVVLPAARGTICDRNGRILASNTMNVSFGADPKMSVSDAPEIAVEFSRVFGKPKSVYMAKLNDLDRHFVWLERRVPPEVSRRIRVDRFKGLIQFTEPQRIYHYDHIAGQSIGFTDIDNNGLSGVELAFDQRLRGTSGYVVMQVDGLRRRKSSVDYPRVEPANGFNIVLTIDLEYQSIAEEELHKGIARSNAESGLAVMLDPVTGEVLAMANFPGINPNKIADAEQSWMKNRVIADMFEPGSVFKVVTAAAAIEHHVLKPDQKIFAENGSYVVRLPGAKPRVITDMHSFGYLTLQEAVEQSSNIVMAKLSNLIGAENFYTTARNFGFGSVTGIELPAEAAGVLKRPNLWSKLTLNTLAYGYEVGATPLQIAAAYAAVANNGVLMKPYLVKQILDDRNEVVYEGTPQVVRRVISRETAQILTRFLVGVVERGTGQAAKVSDVAVAGKTGTSIKYGEGRYEQGNYKASFVGFFPAQAPKVVCLVMLDNPREGGYTGGFASAPIFKSIAEKIIATSERFIPDSVRSGGGEQVLSVPDVVSLKTEAAAALLGSRSLAADIVGNGKVVVKQFPAAGAKLAPNGHVRLVTSDDREAVPAGYTSVPDVRHLTIRRALNLLTMRELGAAVDGSGIVVAQTPAAGERVKIGTRVVVRCEPALKLTTASLAN